MDDRSRVGIQAPVLRVHGLGEVVALVPHVLGVRPEDDLVVVPLRSQAPYARVDVPRSAQERAHVGREMAELYAPHDTGVVVAVFTDRFDRAYGAAEAVRRALEPATDVVATVAAQGDSWVRLDRPDSGEVTQGMRDRLAAEFAFHGRATPYASAREFRDSFAPGDQLPRQQLGPRLLEAAHTTGSATASATERARITLVLDRFVATGELPGDADAARLIGDVQQVGLRDHAWASMTSQNASAHAELWKHLLTRSPDGLAAPLASLATFGYWLSGDGTSARLALERVPHDPPYPMAGLLRLTLDSGISPQSWAVPYDLRPSLPEQVLEPKAVRPGPRPSSPQSGPRPLRPESGPDCTVTPER